MSKMICIDAFRERSSYRSATQRPQSKIVALIRHALRALPNWLAEARQMQQAFETMIAMSDRELEDIGITRSDIPAVVARTYRRDAGTRPIEPA